MATLLSSLSESLLRSGLLLGGLLVVAAIAVAALVAGRLAVHVLRFVLQRRHTRTVSLPRLTGYALERAVRQGEPLRLCLHSESAVKVECLRLDDDTLAGAPPALTLTAPAGRQSAKYHAWQGLNWTVTLEVPTETLSPGLYVVRLSSDEPAAGAADASHSPPLEYFLGAIVQPTSVPSLAVIASTNTWDAYNDFAGVSNYVDRGLPLTLRWLWRAMRYLNQRVHIGERHVLPTVPLPSARPNDAIDRDLRSLFRAETRGPAAATDAFSHLLVAECALTRFLDREHTPCGVYTDRDFATDDRLEAADCFVFNTHSEYWSAEMIGRLQRLKAAGKKIVMLSGNTMYRRVEQLATGLHVVDQKVDRDEIAARIGLGYDARGYQTFAPYRLVAEDHWVFRNAPRGETFCDPSEPPADGSDLPTPHRLAGRPTRGGSGWETDKTCSTSGETIVLARGTNPEGAAEMVLLPLPRGGWLFNAGSVAASAWLGHDLVLDHIVRNLLSDAVVSASPPHPASARSLSAA